MDSKTFVKNYWNYYLELEKQVLRISRYVDFNPQNNATFSIEFLQLFLSIGSEIDVVAKAISKDNYSVSDSETINTWGWKLENIVPTIPDVEVIFNDDYKVWPWKGWYHEHKPTKKNPNNYVIKGKKGNPKWWGEYNKVKHQRTDYITKDHKRTYYSRACLQNVIQALAALFIIENEYLVNTCSKESNPYDYQKACLYKVVK